MHRRMNVCTQMCVETRRKHETRSRPLPTGAPGRGEAQGETGHRVAAVDVGGHLDRLHAAPLVSALREREHIAEGLDLRRAQSRDHLAERVRHGTCFHGSRPLPREGRQYKSRLLTSVPGDPRGVIPAGYI